MSPRELSPSPGHTGSWSEPQQRSGPLVLHSELPPSPVASLVSAQMHTGVRVRFIRGTVHPSCSAP